MTKTRVTRSSAGGVEALALHEKNKERTGFQLDSSAVEERLAGMTRREQELDSRLRGNDENEMGNDEKREVVTSDPLPLLLTKHYHSLMAMIECV
jgi:hypothetical protein